MTDPAPATGEIALPHDLARALLVRLGVADIWNAPEPDTAVLSALTEAMAAHIPYGSMAKLAAVATGTTPPGADPNAVATRILDDEATSWSCHAAVSLAAAMVNARWPGRASVALTHRRDTDAPLVDLHTVLRVTTRPEDTEPVDTGPVDTGDPGVLLTDVYHYAPPLRLVTGSRAVTPWRTYSLEVHPDRSWTTRASGTELSCVLAYREVAPSIDATFLEAVCDISTTHSGVTPRPGARLLDGTRLWRAAERPDGTASLRAWHRDGTDERWSFSGPDAYTRAYAHMREHAHP